MNLPVGGFPISIDLGDLDGDGDLDLVSSNFGGGGDWTVYRNDGAGNFGSAFELDAQVSGSCAVLLDYDRNGRLDIVGIDEAADQMRLWRQDHPPLGGVQVGSSVGQLRIDNRGHRAGFGGQAPHEIVLGETFFLGLSGPPDAGYLVIYGLPLAPGLLSVWGLVNFDPAPGYAVALQGQLDGFGEENLSVLVPPGLPPGVEVVLQAVVTNAGGPRLSNPEIVRLVR